MGRGEAGDLVVDQTHGQGRGDDLDVAQGGRLALARHDPDRAVRDQLGPKDGQGRQIGLGVRGEEHDVGFRERLADRHVVGSRGQVDPEVGIGDPHDRHPGAGLDPELVQPRGGVGAFHPGIVPRMASYARSAGPLLVFGPRSTSYDFGPGHPLTPRRFGPAIDLLRAVGAEPGLAPEPATDDELLSVHDEAYIAAVRRFGADPGLPPAFGIAPFGDVPAFAGMHEAGAAVAGGSLRAIEAILRGDAVHAFHPGGGLHHAMRARASGFCVYNDVALAVAAARTAGLRVLYVDLDVHHGDGVEAIHADDPGVLTVSFHESGRYLFPGTGDAVGGRGPAAGTIVNVPFEPYTGEDAWLAAVRSLVPDLAAAFRPDIVVSQHGADSHAWDPLAHLRVTTTAMGAAARLIDEVAHRHAGGRWLATGGGGYDVYRVVPRAWALTWLAGAHRDPPPETPPNWRERWAAEADEWGAGSLPEHFADEPNAGLTVGAGQRAAEAAAAETVRRVRGLVLPDPGPPGSTPAI